MRRNDLHIDIRSEYNEKKGYGVEKGTGKYGHIWFIIPKPLTLERIGYFRAEAKNFQSVITKANRVVGRLKRLFTIC